MNLALHGFLLQVFLSILNLQHGSVLCSAGEPGYLDFDNLPETNFSCQGKVIGGYYADVEAGCQMFHVCTVGQKDEIMDIKFLCLNGTVFDQETRVCERVDEVDCSKSERFYNLNLELYGNNAVTLSLSDSEDDIDPLDSIDDHPQRTTSARPSITTTTTTTTSKPNKPSTTPASSTFSQPTGYPHHFQPQPPFPQVHTSQSKSLYDDKNGGYHHHYILSHNGEGSNNQQATSYQIFSNQGVSSTTVQPPQVHQIRFSSTASPQIIHNEPSTVSPLFHVTSSTIQTLLSNNGNSPALINPIFHNHGIASTTEQFTLHNNNPRETSEYRENVKHSIRPLEAVQSISEGKVSKLTISPVPTPSEPQRSVQTKTSQSSQQQRILGNFLPTPATDETTVRSFYPTLRSVSKPTQPSQSTSEQVTQHIHVLPPVPIPQLKPHQITINLPPPDIQRIVQNPSPLLPSQSRVIVTAKASVSDESGRPLNTTQLVTLPLPTIPASYDDYKEGDESFDPFYRDVPKIRNARRVAVSKTSLRVRRSVGQTKNSMVSFVYEGDRPKRQEVQVVDINDKGRDKKKKALENEPSDFQAIKESLMKFRDILFGGEFNEDTIRNVFEGSSLQAAEAGKVGGKVSLEDLDTKASKNFKAREYEDSEYDSDSKDSKGDDAEYSENPSKLNTKESDAEEYVDLKGNKEEAEFTDSKEENSKEEESEEEESKEEESKEEESKEENSKEEDSKEENSKEEDSKEENSKEKNSKEDDSKEEDSNEEDLKEEDSNEEDSNEKDLKKEDSNEEESKEKDLKKEDVKDDETKDVDADGVKHVEGKRVLDIVILDPNEYIKMKSSTQESLDSTTEEDPTTTDASILSTTDQTTQSTLADIELTKKKDSKDSEKSGDEIKGTKHSSKYSNVKLEEVNTSKRSKKVEDKKKEESNEESKTHKSKESTETKPNAKRKSSRIRSFSGKIASRKDPKSGEDEAQTEKPTEPTAEEKIVTTTPVVEFEIEQIDKHIFDEPESQTSKEVDTRAVGHQGYAKSLQDGKDQGVEKDIRKGYANEYETLNKQVESLVKDEKEHEEKHEEKHEKKDEEGHEDKHVEKTTVSSLNDGVDTEDEKPVEKSVKVKAKLSKKQKHYYKEESSTESVEDEYNTDASDKETNNSEETKDSEEFKDSEETPVVKTGSRRGKSMKFETSKEVITHRQDKSRKFSGDDEEKEYQEYSTIKGEEVTSREVSSEYHDSTESFYDSSHEIGTENDYKDSTTEPEEDSTSREDAVEGNDEDKPEDDQEDSTEGVLKYTDELPKEKKEELSDSKKSTDSVENSAHDYVDDNYEPDNYKEMEAAKEEKKKKIKDEVGKNEENSEDQVEVTTKSSDTEAEKDDEKKSKDSSGDHVQQTTSTTTTTTTTSTTTTTTTTTVKPTPPKLFKPISIRKSYTYTPPTTTPNPVVIKPRISLLNPKPAKPPRSYNELAPKPVIRKFTLSRKATTTLPTSTVTDEDSTETTEVPVMMTEVPVALTEAPVTTTEARSEENVLEVKLDQEKSSAKDPMQNDQPSVKNEGDQDSSPSEQKSPTNVEKEKGPSSTESFTPYPVTRLSNLASTIRETLKEIESTTDQTTTTKNYTLIELAIISTTVPPLATIPSEPDREEATTLAVVQQEVSTETTVKAHQDSTETSLAPEPSPETTTRTTTTETVLSSSKEPEDVVATTSRYLNRKIATPKRPDSFNCLEKEMYRFYGDTRDCRLFHYCSPGFTSRQVLDFRFVCEEGTAFDEHSQSCKHDVRNGLCPHRKW